MAGGLDAQHASVGLKTKLPQRGKIRQTATKSEVPWVVHGQLRSQCAALLEVLLDAVRFEIHMERRDHALADNARAERTWCSLGHAKLEDQLQVIGPTQVEVLAKHLLEEDPTMHGSIHDLREGKLDLAHRSVVTVAGGLLASREGTRKAVLPLAQESLDATGRQSIGQGLHPPRVVAAQDTVGQFLIADSLLGELPFEILMAVEAKLCTAGEVRTVLQEKRPEVLVYSIEVVLVDHRRRIDDPGIRFTPLVAASFGAEGADLLLGLADEEDSLGAGERSQVLRRHIFFALAFLEADHRNLMLKHVVFDVLEKLFGDRLHLVGGHGSFSVVLAEEVEHGPRSLQLGLVHVEIHPVE